MVLSLSRRERPSAYEKGDLWALCPDSLFAPEHTLLAVNPTYGLPSSGSLDLRPFRFPRSWTFGAVSSVFALHLPNVGSDLTAMDNICENVTLASLPILPQLLAPQNPRGCVGLTPTLAQQALDRGEEMIQRHQCDSAVRTGMSKY